MKTEVQCGCEFISKLLTQRHLPIQFSRPFRRRMEELLMERYRNHWDPSNPNRGSAYRCIRINGCRLDPVVREAAKVTGLTNISEYLPSQLTLWIDPADVSYRFGEDGSICSCSMDLPTTSGVSRASTYGAASPPWSPHSVATTAHVSPVASRTASPSPVKRSTSTPVKHRPLTPPFLPRSVSPSSSSSPSPSGPTNYYMNQMYDSFSRVDFAIPVQV
jgi:protein Tob/BTG